MQLAPRHHLDFLVRVFGAGTGILPAIISLTTAMVTSVISRRLLAHHTLNRWWKESGTRMFIGLSSSPSCSFALAMFARLTGEFIKRQTKVLSNGLTL